MDTEQRFPAMRPNVVYIDDWNNKYPNRRHFMDENNSRQLPLSSNTHDGYVRLLPQTELAQSLSMPPPLGRHAEFMDVRDRNPIHKVEIRPDHRGYRERIVDARDHSNLRPMAYSRAYPSTEEIHNMDDKDESLYLARLSRRGPETNQQYPGDPHSSEFQAYQGPRAAEQQQYETRRLTVPLQAAFKDDGRSAVPVQVGRPVLNDRAPPSYQQMVAPDGSNSHFNFPSRLPSREMESGSVSYPILSHHRHHEFRSLPTREDTIMLDRQSSHQIPQGRYIPETSSFDNIT